MHVAVISPHADDACFSVAENMLTRQEQGWTFTIVCPLVGIPGDEAGTLKMKTLRNEHAHVCEAAGWARANGGFLDDVYGPQAEADVESWFRVVLQSLNPDAVWLPMGIHHPDHVLVARTAMRAWDELNPGRSFTVFEELPYRVLYAEIAFRLRERIGVQDLHAVGYDPGFLSAKRALCRGYGSQLASGPEAERCLYVPERLWEIR